MLVQVYAWKVDQYFVTYKYNCCGESYHFGLVFVFLFSYNAQRTLVYTVYACFPSSEAFLILFSVIYYLCF